MAVLLCGGTNEMVGIGCGMAIIMMSSTPFWLANTGGSRSVAAPAVPAPADKAASRPAAPIHWRIDIFHAVCLLHMGFSFIGYCRWPPREGQYPEQAWSLASPLPTLQSLPAHYRAH